MVTSTQIEQVSLKSGLNLTDGHARQPLTKTQEQIIAAMPSLFREAEGAKINELETHFAESFFCLAGESPPPGRGEVMFTYSASSAISIIAKHISGTGPKVALMSPCFDNIYKLLLWFGITLIPVSERCTRDTRALGAILRQVHYLWITMPNNPTGLTLTKGEFERLAHLCRKNDVTLIVDFSFRFFAEQLDTWSCYDLMDYLEVDYICIEDTGKTFNTLDMKIGFTRCSSKHQLSLSCFYDDLLLCVSPFHLTLLNAFIHDASVEGLWAAVRSRINENRKVISAIYDVGLFEPGSPERCNAPLEWVRICDPLRNNLTSIMQYWRQKGLHILPGDNFFWDRRNNDGQYFRVPLNRPRNLVERGVQIILSSVG